MNVLSLFDGISGAQVALERSGIEVDKYFASEIDKYAIQVTQKNYPNTIQLGDITKWKEWGIPTIDLIIGGSPCQGFSIAGKGLNFSDERSKLFYAMVDIIKHHKPKYFLLENVKMKKEWVSVISNCLDVEPIEINSNLVSAQNRKRLYWCNWTVTVPDDRNIYLKDILEEERAHLDVTERYLSKREGTLAFKKSRGAIVTLDDKARCLMTGGQNISNSGATNVKIDERIYKLSPLECERLQTFPDNYTNYVSDTQRYNCLGNSFTVEVIAHILSSIKQNAPSKSAPSKSAPSKSAPSKSAPSKSAPSKSASSKSASSTLSIEHRDKETKANLVIDITIKGDVAKSLAEIGLLQNQIERILKDFSCTT